MGKNILVAHGGGPTAVINCSLQGVVEAARASGQVDKIYAARFGAEGILAGDLIDLTDVPAETIARLRHTPASAIGSCRRKLGEADYPTVLETLRKFDIDCFFYNGGNDSMDTCNKVSKYMMKSGYECRVMGIPKTIDNDLFGTDHCPGFASAAKYIATSCMEIYQDARVYDTGMVCVVEIMGRHAGWLAGAAGLATAMGAGPDLVYLPETDFDMKKFLADVKKIYDEKGNCLVAVSEGIHYADGSFVSEAKTSATDGFGHAQLGGLASMLADTVKNELGCKVRGIELSLLQRCAAHCASKTDVDESYMSGKAAVENAVAGKTDYMPGFKCTRDENGYKCEIELLPLSEVANTEKKVPRDWINEEGNGVTQAFVDYALPLIEGENVGPKQSGLPRFAKLKKIKAEA